MTFCPICYKQIEKEIWKKENKFKEIRWVFCPNHGYVKDDQQRTSLNAKIQAAKKKRHSNARESKYPPALNNRHVLLIGKGLILSVLFLIVSLSAVLGYFVGMHANSENGILFSTQVEDGKEVSRTELIQNALVQTDSAQTPEDGIASAHILPR